MSTVPGSFTAVAAGAIFRALKDKKFTYSVSGTFTATWVLEREVKGGGAWEQVATGTATQAAVTLVADRDANYRFRCSAFTSGTMVTSIADVVDSIEKVQNRDGLTVFEITEEGIETPKQTVTDLVVTNQNTPDGDVLMQYVDVVVSSAEILALFATPKTLVPAPGANKILVPDLIVAFLDYNSAAYAGIAAGEDWTVKYTNASGAVLAYLETTGFLDQTSDQYRVAKPAGASAAFQPSFTPVANAPLVLHQLTGEITTGNSPVVLRVFYHVIDLTTILSA